MALAASPIHVVQGSGNLSPEQESKLTNTPLNTNAEIDALETDVLGIGQDILAIEGDVAVNTSFRTTNANKLLNVPANTNTELSSIESDILGINQDIGVIEGELALKASESFVTQQIAANDKVILKSFGFEAGAETTGIFAEEDIIYTWPDPANPPAVTITGMTIGQVTPKETYFTITRTNPTGPGLVQLIATIQ